MRAIERLRHQRHAQLRLIYGNLALLSVAIAFGMGWRELLVSLGVWFFFEVGR